MIVAISDGFCRTKKVPPPAQNPPHIESTPQERMVQLKSQGWPGQLRVHKGVLESRNHPEASTDRWFPI